MMCGLVSAVHVSAALMLPGCVVGPFVGATHSLWTGGSTSPPSAGAAGPPSGVVLPDELGSHPRGARPAIRRRQKPIVELFIGMVRVRLATRVPQVFPKDRPIGGI